MKDEESQRRIMQKTEKKRRQIFGNKKLILLKIEFYTVNRAESSDWVRKKHNELQVFK